MQLTVKGKNTDIPKALRAQAERKLAKMERFDDRILSVEVEFSEERNPRVAEAHRVEVTLATKAQLIRASANATDPASALDQVVDRLERQVKKLRGRRIDRTQHGTGTKGLPVVPPEDVGEPLPQIVRRKVVGLQPMSVDAASEAMDLLGYDFYLFTEAATDQPAVVYRRRDGQFGLIVPQA